MTISFGNDLVTTQAIASSQVYVQTLRQSWEVYHNAVIEPLQDIDGVIVPSQYQPLQGNIPSPVTFLRQVSDRLKTTVPSQLFIYSDYPFPHRQETTDSPDPFQQEALDYFIRSSDEQLHRREQMDDTTVFHYAEPLVMETSCVLCHNALPESPKKDWQVGMIAGVIGVQQPLDKMVIRVQDGARHIGQILGLLAGIGLVGMWLIRNYSSHIQQQLYDELHQKSIALERLDLTDPLTNVANQRQFSEALEKEWRRVWRHHGHLSLLKCNVDYFSQYNELYGSSAGDDCLKAIAQTIERQLKRAGDLVARTGGDEFSIILPETNAAEAEEMAAIVMDAVHNLKLSHSSSDVSPYVSVSIGIASTMPSRDHQPDDLIQLADLALHEDAKMQGRNDFAVRKL
ncbi:MAG: diguanylate cyclase [Merismopedia sp. SIO2A8]|nr:diguanylate cyclase [Merismopedia sp. SIO2A8]